MPGDSTMGPDELAKFETRVYSAWRSRASDPGSIRPNESDVIHCPGADG
jgi:hypothetical protein